MSRSQPRKLADVHDLRRSAAQSLWRTHRDPPPQNPTQFLTRNFWPWLTHYLSTLFHARRPFRRYDGSTGIFAIPDTCSIALAGDWGTGTPSAYRVADRIGKRHDVTIHLGDVYYSGTTEEYERWFLGADDWPRGTRCTFALNGNHEMYSGGSGYFDTALGRLGQQASYFCLENRHWRILGLDSGYYARTFPLLDRLLRSHVRLHDDILRWLAAVVFPARDPRPVIVLTHHQLVSAFETEYTTLGKNLAPYLDHVCLWFWGHEHRFTGYGRVSVGGLPPVRGRCIGHGGMPIEVSAKLKRAAERRLVFYDARPDPGKRLDQPIGYCGYAVLQLDGPALAVHYGDETGMELLVERWEAGANGVSGQILKTSPALTLAPGMRFLDLVSA